MADCACGWVNAWTDSGDRGMAKADHGRHCPQHAHLFQVEGTVWTCWGWDGACGLRAPACFTPMDSAVTRKGLIDLMFAASGIRF